LDGVLEWMDLAQSSSIPHRRSRILLGYDRAVIRYVASEGLITAEGGDRTHTKSVKEVLSGKLEAHID